jgi:glycosyltransferase involved in cell wall biosynthesis
VTRVAFRGDDGIGWALDQELRMTRELLTGVKPSPLIFADVLHTMNWRVLLGVPRELMAGKRVISHLTHDFTVAEQSPRFADVLQIVGLWIVRSRRAKERCDDLGLRSALIPYAVDHERFRRLPDRDDLRRAFRERHGIAADAFCIGSFQRDTQSDRKSPKLVKGPDIFADVVERAAARGVKVHVVLAGPRRMWLRDRLRQSGIAITWIGEDETGDAPVLPHAEMNELYNTVDLYVVSSRLEGGPQAILEAAAAECRIISTRVGHADDVLDPACLYDDASDAAVLIASDAANGTLASTVERNLGSSMRHSYAALRPQWRAAYDQVAGIPRLRRHEVAALPTLAGVATRRIRRILVKKKGENRS